jgi:UDP:flavonoid glycosyltransferase YjiC (YdhE family)
MLAIPITNDQPGVAARVAWSGSGALEPLKRTIDQVWSDPSYRQNDQRLQQAIATSGGVSRAAVIVEQAISTVLLVP